MTVFYLEYNNETFHDLANKLKGIRQPVDMQPQAPAHVDADVYNELFCIIQNLRSDSLFPTPVSWLTMRSVQLQQLCVMAGKKCR